jgi:vacuolar-type H+-ATPase subunit E/Vma4
VATADVEVLLADLEAQAASERAKADDETRQKTDEIQARADAEIARIREQAESRLRRLVALDRERITSRFRIEERRRLLEARREALARVFSEARGRLAEGMDPAAYRAMLSRLAAEALAAVGKDADLEVAGTDLALGREIASGLGASGSVRERGDAPGTVVAVSPDGRRRADNSLATRLAQAERLMEEHIAAILLGGTS